MDDFSPLDATYHMLQWLADDPYPAIRYEVEQLLQKRVPDANLSRFTVTGPPDWLTGASPSPQDETKALLVRCGVAIPFNLDVKSMTAGDETFSGIFTWAASQLDTPERALHQIWFDINGDLTRFGKDGELRSRIFVERN